MAGGPLNGSGQEFDPSESSFACHDRCQASPAGAATDLSLPMSTGFGLARPRISVQLYTAIVLTLAVLCTLAGVTTRYAYETIVAVRHLNVSATRGAAVLFSRAEALLCGQQAAAPRRRWRRFGASRRFAISTCTPINKQYRASFRARCINLACAFPIVTVANARGGHPPRHGRLRARPGEGGQASHRCIDSTPPQR